MNHIGNINIEIVDLLLSHGIPAKLKEGKVWSEINPKVYLDSQILSQTHEKGFTTQLDIKFETPLGDIFESFADVGETEEEAVKGNLENFCRNSFHPMIAYLYHYATDDIAIEEWMVNEKQWKVYMGNYGIKASKGKPIAIPEDLFPAIKQFIQGLPLSADLHWFRFYICFTEGEMISSECLVDNELNQVGQQVMESANWTISEEFYSVRLFMLFEKAKTLSDTVFPEEKLLKAEKQNILKRFWTRLTK